MTTKSLVLKRGSISRSCGQWLDEDFDVLENSGDGGRIFCLDAVGPQDRPMDVGERPQRRHPRRGARL